MWKQLFVIASCVFFTACVSTQDAQDVVTATKPWVEPLPADTACVDVHDGRTRLMPPAYFQQITDLAYYPEKGLTGDLWLPSRRKGPFPVIMHVHGGGWSGGHKNLRNARLWAEHFACRGIAFFDIDYVLAGRDGTTSIEQTRQAKCAIRFLKGEAQKYDLDPTRVIVMGGSAGGHLTGMIATTFGIPQFEANCATHPEQDTSVFAAIPVYGIFNFITLQQYRIDVPELGEDLLGKYAPSEAEWYSVSPITYVTPQTPPFLFLQGYADPLVPWQQAVEMGAKLDSVGVFNKVVLIPGATHGFDAFFNSEQTRMAVHEADAFLDTILKN